ncbi:MAG: hypothetical protein AAGI30_11800 [Planctomycetota bacterium]
MAETRLSPDGASVADPTWATPLGLDQAYADFRVGLVRVLTSAGVDPRSGTSIASALGINRQLAWQIATISGESGTAPGLGVLPGKRGLDLFAQACERQLDDRSLVEALRARMRSLEEAITAHTGDRASLGLFAAALDPHTLGDTSEALRRDGFRAQCTLLGIKAATQVRGVIFAPSRRGDPSAVSLATYQCFTDLVRLRRDRPCRLLFIEAPTHDDGSPAMSADTMRAHMQEKFELDAALSTGSIDAVDIVVQGVRGWVVLQPGETGRSGRSNLVFTGSASYEHPRYRTSRDMYNQIGMVTYVPTETMHIDCLIPRSFAEQGSLLKNISVSCFDASTGLPMRPVTTDDPAYLFSLLESQPISATELACDTTTPRMAEAVDRAARRVGCTIDQLVGVRLTSSFAMSPMNFVVSRTLPDRGA